MRSKLNLHVPSYRSRVLESQKPSGNEMFMNFMSRSDLLMFHAMNN